jgi:hypothetical protein
MVNIWVKLQFLRKGRIFNISPSRSKIMKTELMALVLLFAFVGFIEKQAENPPHSRGGEEVTNSRLGPGVEDGAAEVIAFLANGALQPWIDPTGSPA